MLGGLKFYGCVRIITELSTREASVRAYEVVIIDPLLNTDSNNLCGLVSRSVNGWLVCLSGREACQYEECCFYHRAVSQRSRSGNGQAVRTG